MFIVALFVVLNWKQLKCPSSERLDKLWCIHIMDYYAVIKKKEFNLYVQRDVCELQTIMNSIIPSL